MPEKQKDTSTKQPDAATPTEPEVTIPRQRLCGTMPVHHRLLATNPAYVRARIASENFHHEFLNRRARGLAQARTGVTTIPVVVHVVFNTAAQNVSEAQIKSQIDVLNRDFRMKNPDVASVPAPYKSVASDARLEFQLATKDPAGNATNGITRTQTNKTSFPDDDSIKAASSGGEDPWPGDKYLNLWTAPRLTSPQGDLLGYAQFPGGPSATDGVVILHSAFGTSGTAAAPFNLGRTATHEIGHWLNLRHIWGDDGNGCNGSDFVNDTPNQAGPNFGTPGFPHVTCNNGPNGDLFMNYMDYVDDAAMFMFTAGQVDRMQAALDSDRSSIGTTSAATSPALDITGTVPSIDVHPTLKFRDDLPTLKFLDDPQTLKFRDDVVPTLKFRDDLTLKFIDDGFGGGGGTFKAFDDVKMPALDKSPQMDQPKLPSSDLPTFFPPGGIFAGPFGSGRAAPFVLSTPHHSMAWTRSFPEAAQQTASGYEQQIQQYEQMLNLYAEAEAAGRLQPTERQQADALYQEYLALVAEYRSMMGG